MKLIVENVTEEEYEEATNSSDGGVVNELMKRGFLDELYIQIL